MKSDRQHAYEIGVEYELQRRRRSRRTWILNKRFERVLLSLSPSDQAWVEVQLRQRFPDIFID